MHITQAQLKMIAIGLIPVFFILSFILPESLVPVALALVMVAAIVIIVIGMRMEKKEKGGDEDLLALPPKKP